MFGENLSQWHFGYHKSQMKWTGLTLVWAVSAIRPTNFRLSYGKVLYSFSQHFNRQLCLQREGPSSQWPKVWEGSRTDADALDKKRICLPCLWRKQGRLCCREFLKIDSSIISAYPGSNFRYFKTTFNPALDNIFSTPVTLKTAAKHSVEYNVWVQSSCKQTDKFVVPIIKQ